LANAADSRAAANSPLRFLGRAARRAAAARPLLVSAVTVVVAAGGISGCHAAAQAGGASPSASGSAAQAHAPASSPASGLGWPQLHSGPGRAGYQPDETQINVSGSSTVYAYSL
jgi:hypothetical protein